MSSTNAVVDGNGFGAASSPFAPGTPLPEGNHAFEVRAVDTFGPDISPAPAAHSRWTRRRPTPRSTAGLRRRAIDLGDDLLRRDRFRRRVVRVQARRRGLAYLHAARELQRPRRGNSHVQRPRDRRRRQRRSERGDRHLQSHVEAGSGLGLPTGLIIVRPPASFVLIGGSTVKVARNRKASVTLNCSGNRDCAVELVLTTSKKIRVGRKRRGSRSRRRYVRLGAATFFVPAPRSLTVRIPLTKKAFRIVKKRKRIKVTVTVKPTRTASAGRASARATCT